MNNSLTSRSNSSSVWICFSVSMVSSSFDNSRTAPNCFLASSALDNEPSIVEFMILTPQGYITGNCSHIVWNEKKGGPARCVLPDYCSSDRRNIGPLLPRLLPVTCSNTASAVIQLRDNCKTTLGQLWDNFGTALSRVAELGSLSSGAKMAMKIFVFTMFVTNASFLHVIANLPI